MSGRHAAPVGTNFYRDLATMVGGIIVVAAVVYGLLWFISGRDDPSPPSTQTSSVANPTTTNVDSTTRVTTTATTAATTIATTTTAVVLRPPTEVRVLVLNAVGVAGLAAEVSQDLQGVGYQVLTPANYQPALEQSRIWYIPAFEAEAFELAGVAFPDALVEQNPELTADADIVVILGASYER